uniref:Uncharacterized protein TCIL3000_11_11450 n=1 Tax=Trypanosoma congolense (strain IL3000) TaxID=1068625 RepID=G0V1Y5_TRYCI|nr:unnamed protein product [Trypanosoma congolense IL3000]
MGPTEFKELDNLVEQYATRNSEINGWLIKTEDDSSEEPDCVGFSPFANPKAVGMCLSYTRGGVTVGANMSSNPHDTWRDFLPFLKWKQAINGVRHNFLLRLAAAPKFTYTLRHPEFFLTNETCLNDGLNSTCTATTRISPNDQVGLCFTYDPSRSGLKDYTFLLARTGCSAVRGGDILAKYSATHGLKLHVRVPTNPYTSAVVLAEKRRFIMGFEGRSPCGAQLLLNFDIVNNMVTTAVTRYLGPTWEVTLNYTFPVSKGTIWTCPSTPSPRFGVVFMAR